MGIPGKNWTELKHGFHHSNCISDSYKMKATSLTILACIFVSLFMGNIADDKGLAEAPTTSDDCLCQCASTIYLDQSRTLQGNCKSADPTERIWCYIRGDDTIEACGDSFGFDNRYGLFKSYRACTTPEPNSEECINLMSNETMPLQDN